MEYQQMILIFMIITGTYAALKDFSKLPLVIALSGIFLMVNDLYLISTSYYFSEGIRHVATIVAVYLCWSREKHYELYGLYVVLYLGIGSHFCLGLFYLISDVEMDTWALMLNTLELVIFIYGITFKNINSSTIDG